LEGYVPALGESSNENYCYAFQYNFYQSIFTIDEEPCVVDVGVECKVVDKEKYGDDCENLVIPKSECDKDSLRLRYNFTWCSKMDDNIIGRERQTFIKVKGQKKDMGSLNLAPRECRWKQVTVKVNTCKGSTPAGIQYGGRLNGVPGTPGWCKAYQFLNIPIKRPPVVPTPEPSFKPSETVEECILLITELMDPKGEQRGRYVELYSPNCPGRKIRDNLFLIRWIGGNTVPTTYTISLRDKIIGDDGFLIFCRNPSPSENGYAPGTCDYQGTLFGPADSEGKDSVAIVRDYVNPTGAFDIVDIYGEPGNALGGIGTEHDYRNGRATRKTSAIDPKDVWDANDWFVTPANRLPRETATVDDADPRVWKDPPLVLIITEIADPIGPLVLKPGGGSIPPRFVELYSPRQEYCGELIDDPNLKLITWKQGKPAPAWQKAISLDNKMISTDCFIVICNVEEANTVYDNLCDYYDMVGGTVDTNGDDHIAIVQGNPGDFEILDLYGRPGTDGTGTDHDFEDGRAIRLVNSTSPNNPWNVYNWEVIKGGQYAGDMDPHLWVPLDELSDPPSTSPRPSPGSEHPSPSPSKSPLPTPDESCELDLIITEVTSPKDSEQLRYVEIYSKCADYTIRDDYKLVIFPEDNGDWKGPINLQGITIPTDGFIVICKSNKVDEYYGAGTCDMIGGASSAFVPSPVDSNGDDNIAILLFPDDGSDPEIVDVFGVPGIDGTETEHDFTGGRGVRKTSATEPNDEWDPDEWDVFSIVTEPMTGATKDDMDPRVWEDIPLRLIITEVADPADDFKFRFVELFSENKPGQEIEKLCLARWRDDSSIPTIKSLNGFKTDSNGFLVLCAFEQANDKYGGKCDHVLDGYGSVANVRGGDHVAIIKCAEFCDRSDGHCIVDLYGTPTKLGVGTDHDFTDGRGVRKTRATTSKKVWDFDDWYVIPGRDGGSITSDGMDPGVWEDGVNCDYDFIITEIVDPKDNKGGRYLELYTSDTCIWGKVIARQLSVIMWDEDESVPNVINYIPLSGVTVGDDGFVVLCAGEEANIIYAADTDDNEGICDLIAGVDGPADTDGTSPIAVVEGGRVDDGSFEFTRIVDQFGEVGKTCDVKNYCFTDGRVVRNRIVLQPNEGDSNRPDWLITDDANTDDSDPGEWEAEEPPELEPTPCPTPFKGKGKNNKLPGEC